MKSKIRKSIISSTASLHGRIKIGVQVPGTLYKCSFQMEEASPDREWKLGYGIVALHSIRY